MNFNLSEEQEMLKASARDFLNEKFPQKVVSELEKSEPGYSPEIWKEMAELGWMGLAFPEEYGGSGMSFLDLAVLLEEMGRVPLPGPYFSTVVLGGLPVCDAGSEAQKQRFLPKIASGEMLSTLALTEPNARYDAAGIGVKATDDRASYTLNGTKLFVADAHLADFMLVAARTNERAEAENGITLFIADAKSPGISYQVLKTISNDKLYEVTFNNVKVPGGNILGELNKGWDEIQKITRRAAVALCCEMVGGAQRVLEMTVDYAKERVQFGHPIGSFQAIQHDCANLATDIDGARLVTCKAAWMISQDLLCDKEVAAAKVWAGDTYQRATALSHQIHGALGFTMDYGLHFYTRQAKAAQVTFGDADFYREVVAQEIGLA